MALDENGERAREQCFLSSFADLFARVNGKLVQPSPTEEEYLIHIRQELARAGNIDAEQFNIASGTKIYENFTSVMTQSPGSLVNRLVTDEGLVELFDLRPEQMSAIMPKIRIFKMVYPDGPDGIVENQELFFEGSYDPESIRQMMNNRAGRGAGVGLKSFEWELLGTNTAEVDNNIKANLKLYFQNFSDLVSTDVMSNFSACQRNQSVIDALPDWKASFLDLIFRSQKFGGEDGDFNEKYYRIKVVLGWTVDRSMIGAGKLFTSTLAEKINNVGTTLLLSLLSHSIDFREDGTIELDLEYHAAVESMLTDKGSNLLYASSEVFRISPNSRLWSILLTAGLREEQIRLLSANDLLAILDGELVNLQNELQEQQNAEVNGSDTTTESECRRGSERVSQETGIGGLFGIGDDVEELIEVDQEAVRRVRSILKSRIYTRFLEELLNKGRLFSATVPKSVLEGDSVESVFSSIAANFNELVTVVDLQVRQSTMAQRAGTRWARRFLPQFVGNLLSHSINDEGELEVEESNIPIADSIRGDRRRITYFYLGDLLDVALNILKRPDNPEEFGDINILLGTVFLYLPRFRSSNFERRWWRRATQAYAPEEITPTRLINMADIPISVNLFIQFFTERVIARDRTEWTFRTFLREVFSYLIYPSIGTDCVARSRIIRPNIDILHISAYGDQNDEDRVGIGRIIDQNIPSITKYNGRLSDRKLYHYVIIQANNFNSIGRNAMDPESPIWDAAEGIYWLNIGNPRGIVKGIKFKKTDQAGLRESRMEREGSIGLGQLRDKYDADVTLFGNGLFQPGQLIYLNPTVIGLQSPGVGSRLSSILGIGGYHQIITVDSAISDNTYETILNTKWVGAGVPNCLDEEEDPCA